MSEERWTAALGEGDYFVSVREALGVVVVPALTTPSLESNIPSG